MHNVVKIVCLMVVLSLAFHIGCSGNSGQIVTPGDEEGVRGSVTDGSGSCMWGMWEVTIEKSTGEVNITRLREADLALNVLGFLEPPALVNLTIDFDTLVSGGCSICGGELEEGTRKMLCHSCDVDWDDIPDYDEIITISEKRFAKN